MLMRERQIFDKPTIAHTSIHVPAPSKKAIMSKVSNVRNGKIYSEHLSVNYQHPVTQPHNYNAELYPQNFQRNSADNLIQSLGIYG